MMMESLRHFLLIVEHGTFTEAAKRAHLSQPALTQSIRRLEEELGARLLHRGRGGAQPTAEGLALVPRARAALAAVEDGRRAVREVLGVERGEVRIGAGGTACTYLLPPVIASFRAEHPGVRFFLREQTPEEALTSLDAGEIDLAVVPADRGDAWVVDELVLVAAPGERVEGAPFVTFRAGASTRSELDRAFPDAEVVMELGSVAAVKAYVRAGVGVALVSKHAVRTEVEKGELAIVKSRKTPVARTIRVVHRGLDRLSPAAAALRARMLARQAPSARRRRGSA